MKQYSFIQESYLEEVAWGTLFKATGERLKQGNFGDKLQTLKSLPGNIIRNATGARSATRQLAGGIVRSSNAAHMGRNLTSASKMRGVTTPAARQMGAKGSRLTSAASAAAKKQVGRAATIGAINATKAGAATARVGANAASAIAGGATRAAGAAAKGIGYAANKIGQGANWAGKKIQAGLTAASDKLRTKEGQLQATLNAKKNSVFSK